MKTVVTCSDTSREQYSSVSDLPEGTGLYRDNSGKLYLMEYGERRLLRVFEGERDPVFCGSTAPDYPVVRAVGVTVTFTED